MTRYPHPPMRIGFSIERRLALLMAAVLVAVLATSLVLTYRTLATAARSNASARLAQVAQLLSAMVEQQNRQRAALYVRVARDPATRAILRAAAAPGRPLSPATIAAAESLLHRLDLPADSGLPAALWTADGRRVAGVGVDVDAIARPEMAAATPASFPAEPTESIAISAPYADGGRVYYRIVAPVYDGAARLGYLAVLRRVGNNRNLASQVRMLTGEEASLYVHQEGAPLWASLAGTPAAAPTPVSPGVVSRPDGGVQLIADAPIRGTPWRLALEEPMSVVLARPRSMVGTLALISGLLTITGAAAAWAMGRRIARPLTELTAATEAIARGDYKSRVPDNRPDEVGRLARSFNTMAGEVDAAVRDAEHARDAAERANRAKSDFLAVMSHELRTPLNAIGGYAELLQLGIYGPVTEEQTRALSRVAKSQQHLLALIDDVLNFARIAAAKVQYHLADVPVHAAVAAVEPMIAPQLGAKRLRYTQRVPAGVVARADDEKLRQVVLNLLSNAVKFTPEGGTVSVECDADDTTVRLTVRDTGVGIPADRLRHIFEPFVQADRALNRPHDGVGLGLSISHDLALGMHGTLTAESTPGEGSTFTLALPRA